MTDIELKPIAIETNDSGEHLIINPAAVLGATIAPHCQILQDASGTTALMTPAFDQSRRTALAVVLNQAKHLTRFGDAHGGHALYVDLAKLAGVAHHHDSNVTTLLFLSGGELACLKVTAALTTVLMTGLAKNRGWLVLPGENAQLAMRKHLVGAILLGDGYLHLHARLPHPYINDFCLIAMRAKRLAAITVTRVKRFSKTNKFFDNIAIAGRARLHIDPATIAMAAARPALDRHNPASCTITAAWGYHWSTEARDQKSAMADFRAVAKARRFPVQVAAGNYRFALDPQAISLITVTPTVHPMTKEAETKLGVTIAGRTFGYLVKDASVAQVGAILGHGFMEFCFREVVSLVNPAKFVAFEAHINPRGLRYVSDPGIRLFAADRYEPFTISTPTIEAAEEAVTKLAHGLTAMTYRTANGRIAFHRDAIRAAVGTPLESRLVSIRASLGKVVIRTVIPLSEANRMVEGAKHLLINNYEGAFLLGAPNACTEARITAVPVAWRVTLAPFTSVDVPLCIGHHVTSLIGRSAEQEIRLKAVKKALRARESATKAA